MESKSFDGKHTLVFDEEKHTYHLNGKRIPGATTVGAAYPKGDGLIRWMIKQGIEEYDTKKKLKAAADIGTILHDYAFAVETSTPFDYSRVTGHKDSAIIESCIVKFQEWLSANADEVLHNEIIVASPTLEVGGKIDTVRQRGELILVSDYKTSSGIYISAFHQTALYKRMMKEWYNMDTAGLEIVKFGKKPTDKVFESCFVTNEGCLLNGVFTEHPGLMDELEAQAVRNVATYRHQRLELLFK